MIASISKNTNEILLNGNAKELDFLSKQLLIDNTIVNLEYKNLGSSPHLRDLESIQVKHFPNQAVKISVKGNSLLIEGSPEKLKILSENIEIQENELKNYHIHIEYYECHFYLSKDSIPLVVSFQ